MAEVWLHSYSASFVCFAADHSTGLPPCSTCVRTRRRRRDGSFRTPHPAHLNGEFECLSPERQACSAHTARPLIAASARGSGEVESLAWNPHQENRFLVATDDGMVSCYDAAKPGSAPVFVFKAHRKVRTPSDAVDSALRLTNMDSQKIQFGFLTKVALCLLRPESCGPTRKCRQWQSTSLCQT